VKTIVLENPGSFAITEAGAPPRPGPGEALVRVLTVGLCGTDLHAFRGDQPFFSYPRILGHELAVEVLETGDAVGNVKAGDRCAVNPYMTCGVCAMCRSGRTNCCPEMKVFGVHIDGGMRERVVLPAEKLYRCETLNSLEIALVETLGIGAHAVGRSGARAGDRAMVIGAGPIGLSVLEFLRIEGVEAGLVERNRFRLEFAAKKHALARYYESHEQAKTDTPSSIVFDCTGDRASMEEALFLMAHGGTLVFVGLIKGTFAISDPDLHRREATILSSRNCTAPEHRRVVELMEARRIDVSSWPSEVVAPAQMPERLPYWGEVSNGIVKGAVDFER
jgi:2-desacetyl-2-hydroxyethyl bacteriochlorophyllide A dehydrogenase